MIQNRLLRIYEQIQSGQRDEAFEQLRTLINLHPNDERVWFLLSMVVTKLDEQRYCLERVLKLDPDNTLAQKQLDQLNQRILAGYLRVDAAAVQLEALLQLEPESTEHSETNSETAAFVETESITEQGTELMATTVATSTTHYNPAVPAAPEPPPLPARPPEKVVSARGKTEPHPVYARPKNDPTPAQVHPNTNKTTQPRRWLLPALIIGALLLCGASAAAWRNGWLGNNSAIPSSPSATATNNTAPTLPAAATESLPTSTTAPTETSIPATATETPALNLPSPTPDLGQTATALSLENPNNPPTLAALPAAPKGLLAFVQFQDESQDLLVQVAPERLDFIVRPPFPLLANTGTLDFSPAWSPDGSRLAWAGRKNGQFDIWIINADGTGLQNLTQSDGQDQYPTWSPDGQSLAFVSNRSGSPQIYQIRADGKKLIQLTKLPKADVASLSWSPRDTEILFATDVNGNWDIWAATPNTGGIRHVLETPANDQQPAYSPRGDTIAFVSDRDGNDEVYIMGNDGNNPYNLSDDPASDIEPSWSPDGQWLVFASNRYSQTDYDIYMRGVGYSEPMRLTANNRGDEHFPIWQPR
jgi:hypothetical protein